MNSSAPRRLLDGVLARLLLASLVAGASHYTSEPSMVLGARCPFHLKLALANQIWVVTTTLRFSQII